jgi:hypothetical protein
MMIVAQEVGAFAYAVGEEVVVRLDGVAALDLDAEAVIGADRLPTWTIAALTACVDSGTRRQYAARFLHDDAICIAVIDESAIEGTA